MATIYQTKETITLASNPNATTDVFWWKTTSDDVSVVSTVVGNQGIAVANWTKSTAVNGVFFPNDGTNNQVNAFAINKGAKVLNYGDENYEDYDNRARPLDFMMDPKAKAGNYLLIFGNGGKFPLSVSNRTVNIADVNWGVGGMDLNMANSSFDTRATFNSQWKWRNQMSTTTLAKRTVMGYTGGSVATTNYIVAMFGECEMFDVRKWLKSKGVTTYGLYFDGGGSTSGKNNGTILVSSTRRIPVIIAM